MSIPLHTLVSSNGIATLELETAKKYAEMATATRCRASIAVREFEHSKGISRTADQCVVVSVYALRNFELIVLLAVAE